MLHILEEIRRGRLLHRIQPLSHIRKRGRRKKARANKKREGRRCR